MSILGRIVTLHTSCFWVFILQGHLSLNKACSEPQISRHRSFEPPWLPDRVFCVIFKPFRSMVSAVMASEFDNCFGFQCSKLCEDSLKRPSTLGQVHGWLLVRTILNGLEIKPPDQSRHRESTVDLTSLIKISAKLLKWASDEGRFRWFLGGRAGYHGQSKTYKSG